MSVAQITPQQQAYLLQLASVTYQSINTQQIAAATSDFISFVAIRCPKSFTKLQQLISRQGQLPLNLRKALVSLYKASVDHMKQVLENECRHNEEIFSSQKQLLHVVEHAFDNRAIQTAIKHPISQSYVSLYMFFNPDNFQRLMSKSKYYFNIKEDLLALDMLQIYHLMDSPFKFKVEFYGPCIRMLMEYLSKKLNVFYSTQPTQQIDFMIKMKKHLDFLRDVWCSLTFELYQVAFCKQLKEPNTARILQMMTGHNFPLQFHQNLFQIAQHIVSGLVRTHLVQKTSEITHILIQLAKRQFSTLTVKAISTKFEPEIQAILYAKIKFLVSCCDCTFTQYPLFAFQPTIFDIFSKLIFPHYLITQQYIHIHSDNINEIIDFLADMTYTMKSECKETIMNKLIINICRSSSEIRKNMKMVVSAFFFQYLPRVTNNEVQSIKSHLFGNEAVQFWQDLSQEIDKKNIIMSVLHFIAFTPELFYSDLQFLNVFNNFMGLNSQFLLTKDAQVSFYVLMIFKNYKEDIFSDNQSSAFKAKVIDIALRGETIILKDLGLTIIKEQLQDSPPYDSVYLLILRLFEAIHVQLDQRFLPVVNLIFKNYSASVGKLKNITSLIQNILESFIVKIGRQRQPIQKNVIYFGIFQQFMKIQEFSSVLPKLILEVIQVIANIPNKTDGDPLLFFMVKGLKALGELPEAAESLLMKFKWQFEDIEIVNSFTVLLDSTRNEQFVNWLFQAVIQRDFTISHCLLIHSIIYYQLGRLNPNSFKFLIEKIYYRRMITRASIDYINGKLNIILLLILKLNRELFYSFLKRENWHSLQEKVRSQLVAVEVLQKNKSQTMPFIDEIFSLLYVSQYSYCWKYDKQVFLVIQLKLLLNNIDEQYQLRYANVSFVACTKNILRCYEIITSEIELQEPQSEDEDIFPAKQYDEAQLKQMQVTSKYTKPAQFSEDYFELYGQLVQKLKSSPASHQWMNTIYNKVFDHQDIYHLEQILSLKKTSEGKIRKIMRYR